jgi:2-polyprenyl-3-methyl-5-hydroxy-6-metoxy-1,4-benzoquinol methylase
MLNQWCLRRAEKILQILHGLGIHKPSILDLGCGTGWLTEMLARVGPTTGVDFAEDIIATAQARFPHITFLAGDIFRLPLPIDHFDVVVSQEVIAHVHDQSAYIDCAANVLKADGYLILTTPNKFVMDRSAWPLQPPEHLEQWLTMRRLKSLLRRRFRVLRTTTMLPRGHGGVLRLINSYKVNAVLGLLMPQHSLEGLKERAGFGLTLTALAQKRS